MGQFAGVAGKKVIGVLLGHYFFCMEQGLSPARGCHNYPGSLRDPHELPPSLLHEVAAAGQEQCGVTVKSGRLSPPTQSPGHLFPLPMMPSLVKSFLELLLGTASRARLSEK